MTSRRTNIDAPPAHHRAWSLQRPCSPCTLSVAPLRAASDEELSPMLMSPDAVAIKEVQFHQRLDNQVDVNAKFTNSDGQETTLAECMDGKPTVFVLAYYRCPRLCNMVLNGVAKVLQAIDFEAGKDFNIVVVSFDATDTDRDRRRQEELGRPRLQPRTATRPAGTSSSAIRKRSKAAAESVGFQYVYDKKSGEYAHASGIVLLTPEGRVSRYFYGIDYPTRDVRLGLVEASQGQIGSPVDELLAALPPLRSDERQVRPRDPQPGARRRLADDRRDGRLHRPLDPQGLQNRALPQRGARLRRWTRRIRTSPTSATARAGQLESPSTYDSTTQRRESRP